MSEEDGAAMVSMSHPVPPWWKRALQFFRLRRGLSPSSLEHGYLIVDDEDPRKIRAVRTLDQR